MATRCKSLKSVHMSPGFVVYLTNYVFFFITACTAEAIGYFFASATKLLHASAWELPPLLRRREPLKTHLIGVTFPSEFLISKRYFCWISPCTRPCGQCCKEMRKVSYLSSGVSSGLWQRGREIESERVSLSLSAPQSRTVCVGLDNKGV